jgi:hypothetical protein
LIDEVLSEIALFERYARSHWRWPIIAFLGAFAVGFGMRRLTETKTISLRRQDPALSPQERGVAERIPGVTTVERKVPTFVNGFPDRREAMSVDEFLTLPIGEPILDAMSWTHENEEKVRECVHRYRPLLPEAEQRRIDLSLLVEVHTSKGEARIISVIPSDPRHNAMVTCLTREGGWKWFQDSIAVNTPSPEERYIFRYPYVIFKKSDARE